MLYNFLILSLIFSISFSLNVEICLLNETKQYTLQNNFKFPWSRKHFRRKLFKYFLKCSQFFTFVAKQKNIKKCLTAAFLVLMGVVYFIGAFKRTRGQSYKGQRCTIRDVNIEMHALCKCHCISVSRYHLALRHIPREWTLKLVFEKNKFLGESRRYWNSIHL